MVEPRENLSPMSPFTVFEDAAVSSPAEAQTQTLRYSYSQLGPQLIPPDHVALYLNRCREFEGFIAGLASHRDALLTALHDVRAQNAMLHQMVTLEKRKRLGYELDTASLRAENQTLRSIVNHISPIMAGPGQPATIQELFFASHQQEAVIARQSKTISQCKEHVRELQLELSRV
ncbi:hypothetical protein LOZ43_005583 [Ophidiomyces ophidiicola]|nr:hypothetical protein LOZ43_005583 [Ophidiomyces ophidiicola]